MKTPPLVRRARATCLFLMAAFLAGTALAQPMRTLTIQDGLVVLDGERLSDEALPDSLDLSGFQGFYSFTVDAPPLIPLGGRLYTVEGKTLIEVDPDVAGASGGPSVSMFFSGSPDVPAAAFQSRSMTLSGISPQALTPGALGARRLAPPATTSWLARPPTDAQRYLTDMQRENEQLHERLMQERRMELESQVLAARIRTLPEDSPEREGLTSELREKLAEIFSMKEENRRRETEQLEKELSELRDQLQKREANRDAIIDRRLDELLGRRQPMDW